MFSESKSLSESTFIERCSFKKITQIIVICQNNYQIIIIFKIIFLLLKCCDNKQKLLIMNFILNLNENYFFRIRYKLILLHLRV